MWELLASFLNKFGFSFFVSAGIGFVVITGFNIAIDQVVRILRGHLSSLGNEIINMLYMSGLISALSIVLGSYVAYVAVKETRLYLTRSSNGS